MSMQNDGRPTGLQSCQGNQVEHLGDEWTAEDTSGEGTTYGLDEATIKNFSKCLSDQVLDRYLPAHSKEGLEIGPAEAG